MKPATRFKLSALSACCVVALYGCGGGGGDGGGGDANPQSDQQTNNNRNNSNDANNRTTPDSTVEGTTLVADKIAQYGGTRTSHKVTPFPTDISSSLALGENVLKDLEVRLNDQGRVVAAIATQVLDEKGSSLRRNVSYAKFDFQNGWGKPVEIAKFSGLQSSEIEISAAINHAGKAMVTY